MLLWRSEQHLCDVIDSGSSVADIICLLSNAKQRATDAVAAASTAIMDVTLPLFSSSTHNLILCHSWMWTLCTLSILVFNWISLYNVWRARFTIYLHSKVKQTKEKKHHQQRLSCYHIFIIGHQCIHRLIHRHINIFLRYFVLWNVFHVMPKTKLSRLELNHTIIVHMSVWIHSGLRHFLSASLQSFFKHK